jgi:hypothetical protein
MKDVYCRMDCSINSKGEISTGTNSGKREKTGNINSK